MKAGLGLFSHSIRLLSVHSKGTFSMSLSGFVYGMSVFTRGAIQHPLPRMEPEALI